MLVKLTPGVNFPNILGSAFMLADLKNTKKTFKLSSFFALLGSLRVKAMHKHVDEIDTWNLLEVTQLTTHFYIKSFHS